MRDAHVNIKLSAEFILDRVIPTAAELAYGYHKGWVSPEAVVTLALTKGQQDIALHPAEERIALLLSDQFDQVDDLIDEITVVDRPGDSRERVWLFLALAWLYEHRVEFDDVYKIIDWIYSDFAYPDEISGFVSFMPLKSGEMGGHEEIDKKWRRYLQHTQDGFTQRSARLT